MSKTLEHKIPLASTTRPSYVRALSSVFTYGRYHEPGTLVRLQDDPSGNPVLPTDEADALKTYITKLMDNDHFNEEATEANEDQFKKVTEETDLFWAKKLCTETGIEAVYKGITSKLNDDSVDLRIALEDNYFVIIKDRVEVAIFHLWEGGIGEDNYRVVTLDKRKNGWKRLYGDMQLTTITTQSGNGSVPWIGNLGNLSFEALKDQEAEPIKVTPDFVQYMLRHNTKKWKNPINIKVVNRSSGVVMNDIKIEAGATVGDLKEKIVAARFCPPDRTLVPKLLFKCEPLFDDLRSLSDYGIGDGDKVTCNIAIKMTPGGTDEPSTCCGWPWLALLLAIVIGYLAHRHNTKKKTASETSIPSHLL